jgi:uncharacterized membrane protein YjgN (DUF898 family)
MEKHYGFGFSGKGSEYFRIWIVNVALTLITLGIYSAWAKVRTLRWFYGHTLLANHSFSYTASPLQILKGRIIAAVLLAIYVLASKLVPLLASLLMLILLILSPWIIVSSLRFSARQSAYRGIRFNFTGSISKAAVVYLLLPAASMLTVGLLLPYTAYAQVRYLASHYTYGDAEAAYQGTSKPFWGVYLGTLLFLVVVWAIVGSLLYFNYTSMQFASEEAKKAAFATAFGLGFFAFYVSIPVAAAIIKTKTVNLFYNHLSLKEVRFRSSQRARDMVWIYATNLLLMLLTLGFYYPFAQVRIARYKAAHLYVIAENLDEFSAKAFQQTGAAAEEISDLFDMDVGLG